jgi:hypothetical protein
MVEIDFGAQDWGQTAQIFVICIVLKKGYPVWTNALENGLGDRSLSGSRSASYANDKWAAIVHG